MAWAVKRVVCFPLAQVSMLPVILFDVGAQPYVLESLTA